jgi:hypothetical protein
MQWPINGDKINSPTRGDNIKAGGVNIGLIMSVKYERSLNLKAEHLQAIDTLFTKLLDDSDVSDKKSNDENEKIIIDSLIEAESLIKKSIRKLKI